MFVDRKYSTSSGGDLERDQSLGLAGNDQGSGTRNASEDLDDAAKPKGSKEKGGASEFVKKLYKLSSSLQSCPSIGAAYRGSELARFSWWGGSSCVARLSPFAQWPRSTVYNVSYLVISLLERRWRRTQGLHEANDQ